MTTKKRHNTYQSWLLLVLAFAVTFGLYYCIKYHVQHRRESPNKYWFLLGTTFAQGITCASFFALETFASLIIMVGLIYVLVLWIPKLEQSFDVIIVQNLGSPDDFVEATLFAYIAYMEQFYYIALFIDFFMRFPYYMSLAYNKITGKEDANANDNTQAV